MNNGMRYVINILALEYKNLRLSRLDVLIQLIKMNGFREEHLHTSSLIDEISQDDKYNGEPSGSNRLRNVASLKQTSPSSDKNHKKSNCTRN
jgi:hypothetical protein